MLCFQGHHFSLTRIIRGQQKGLSELRSFAGRRATPNESKDNEISGSLGSQWGGGGWVVLPSVREVLMELIIMSESSVD